MIIDVGGNSFNRYMGDGNVDIASLYGKGEGSKNYQWARAVGKVFKDFATNNVWETLIADKVADDREKRARGSVFKKDIGKFTG